MHSRKYKWISFLCLLGVLGAGVSNAVAGTAPAWWINAGVLDTNAPADFAPANKGQAKYFAFKTWEMLDATLPGGAGVALSNQVQAFSLFDNHVAVNLGQLKTLARPFYDRLGYSNQYPWTETTADDRDYAPANIGQVKKLFSFDGDRDDDGLPDWWETAHGLNPDSGISPSLVAWWKFDEGSGNKAYTSAGPLYTGIVNSGQSWCRGRSGRSDDYALQFDGSVTGVTISQNPVIVTQAPFSISAWVINKGNKGDIITDTYQPVPGAGKPYRGFFIRCSVDPSERFVHFIVGEGSSEGNIHAYDAPDAWTHFVATYDGTTLCIYENGRLEERQSYTSFVPAMQLELGIGSEWTGIIDDVRIYKTALSENEVRVLFEASEDSDNDGLRNAEEYAFLRNPGLSDNLVYTNRYMSDGAIDITFMPTNWATNSVTRYLAAYGTADREGMKLYVNNNDELHFEIWDRYGFRHMINHQHLMRNQHVINNWTNRIVASWKNLNTHSNDAEMRLFVNGIDYNLTFAGQMNPKLTQGEWLLGRGYVEASASTIEFPCEFFTNDVFSNSLCTNHHLSANVVDRRVHTTAYGLVADATPPFDVGPKTPRETTNRCLSIAQCLQDRWLNVTNALTESRADRMVRQQHQYFDGAELGVPWIFLDHYWWETNGVKHINDCRPEWGVLESNAQLSINVAYTQGFRIARSGWREPDKLYLLYSNIIDRSPAMRIEIELNGTAVLRKAKAECQLWERTRIDMADSAAVSNYMALLKQELGHLTNYAYFLFNEDALESDMCTYASSTCTSNGLAWFREYVRKKYGESYSNLKFPVCPINYRAITNQAPPGLVPLVTLSPEASTLCELTTDPGIWSLWWEWRNVVFAHWMNVYCNILHELYSNNPAWKGTIYFPSPTSAWAPVRGVDLKLLSKIPGLTWMVMENHRTAHYGNYCMKKKQVWSQLDALKSILDTNTGFGSYAMVDNYMNNPSTCNPEFMVEDVDYAVSPEFQSEIIVPFSSGMIVFDDYWPSNYWTSAWHQVHHMPAADTTWCSQRFERLWIPVTNLTCCTNLDQTVTLNWSWPEQAKGFQVIFSTDSSFSTTNADYACMSNGFNSSDGSLPAGVPLYWQARGSYEVLYIATNGSVVATNTYYGAWSRSRPDTFALPP